jgi:hypothetical protein
MIILLKSRVHDGLDGVVVVSRNIPADDLGIENVCNSTDNFVEIWEASSGQKEGQVRRGAVMLMSRLLDRRAYPQDHVDGMIYDPTCATGLFIWRYGGYWTSATSLNRLLIAPG